MDPTGHPAAENDMTSTQPLLQPYRMQDLTLRNRVVMPALTRCRADNSGLVPNELMARYDAQRASAGLIIGEVTWVSSKAIGINNVPGLFSSEQIEGWRRVTDAVHARGGTMFAQLWRAGAVERMGGQHVGLKVGPCSDEAGLMTANADTMNTYDHVLTRLNDYDLAHIRITGTQTDVSATPIASLAGDGMFLRARTRYRGTLIVNAAFDPERANRALREGWADLVAFGRAYIANPDFAERFRDGQPLHAVDKSTAYTSGPRGYTDCSLANGRKTSDLATVKGDQVS